MMKISKPGAYLITPTEHLKDYSRLIELAARKCYKSEDRICEGSDEKIIRSLIRREHLSVIEHCSVTFDIHCSRACSHQLVRHRIASYSQQSQRYIDLSDEIEFIVPPGAEGIDDGYRTAWACYRGLRSVGVPAEDARYVLPAGTKTELVVTMNLRTWREVLEKRWVNEHAQWEIRKVMSDVARVLKQYLPVFFEDLEIEV